MGGRFGETYAGVPELFGTVHVHIGILRQSGNLLLVQGADDPPGAPHHQGVVGDLLAFGDQGIGADQTVFANDGMIQDHRPDSDQRAGAHRTAMQYGAMSDTDIFCHAEGGPGVGMEQCAILHIAAPSDVNRFIVAAQDCLAPYAGLVLQNDLADEGGTFLDKGRGRNLRGV